MLESLSLASSKAQLGASHMSAAKTATHGDDSGMNCCWSQLRAMMAACPALEAQEVSAPAQALTGATPAVIERFQTDTRQLVPGDLFVALQGESFDGHDFLSQAKARGAVGAIAQRGLMAAGLSGFEVKDSTRALGEMAQAWRAQFELGLIAVTGSNGKTTVTQMLASVLRAWVGEDALATRGNFNNAIGVPLTLLRLRAHHRCGVLELGMNHVGEIESLARWVAPRVALVNNAQREHQEFMGSVHAVAEENGRVLQALSAGGVAVFPMDDEFEPLWSQMAGSHAICRFGRRDGAHVQLLEHAWQGSHYAMRVLTPQGQARVTLHMAGEHHVSNALACVACAVSLGVPLSAVAQGLSEFRAVTGRGQLHLVGSDTQAITLVDDTYNANPDSVLAAIDVLKQMPQPSVLVLGDMGEVGENGELYHQEVGEYAQSAGISVMLTLGDLSKASAHAFAAGELKPSSSGAYASTNEGLAQLLVQLDRELQSAKSVLVKGSRFMRMERVVNHVLSKSANLKDTPCS